MNPQRLGIVDRLSEEHLAPQLLCVLAARAALETYQNLRP